MIHGTPFRAIIRSMDLRWELCGCDEVNALAILRADGDGELISLSENEEIHSGGA